jgi:WD40 repeat protein
MPPDEDRIDKKLIEIIKTWIQQGAAKDLKHAKQIALQRAAERQKATLAAAARTASKPSVAVVMPENIKRIIKEYPERAGSMRTLATSPTSPLIAVPGFHQILLLHQDNLRELGVLDFEFGQVEQLAFSPDGTTLIAAGGTAGKLGGTVLFDVKSGREIGQYSKQRDVILSASVSEKGLYIATGDTRRRITVTRASDGNMIWQHHHDDWVTAVAFSQDGKLLASADRTGSVVVREAENGREVHSMKAADGLVSDLAFSPDVSMLATSGADRSVSLYRMRDGRRLFRQLQHQDQVLCIAWRTSKRLISSGADGRIMQWKTNGQRDTELPRIGEWVYGIGASKDGSRVFTSDWKGRLIAINAKTRKVLTKLMPLAVRQ